MTLFIHIGIGKTGTTAIQDSLFENKNRLLSDGFVYPDEGLQGTGHHLLCPPDYISGHPDIEKAWALIRELALSNDEKKIILSSEHFSYIKREHLERISSILQGVDVKIILYIRPQLSLLESTYLQWQKNSSNYTKGIESFWLQHAESFDFFKLIKTWADFFGSTSIVARLFDRAITGPDVCRDFYSVVGAPFQQRLDSLANDSILPEFSRLIEKLDRLAPGVVERQLIINELLVCSRILKKASCVSLIDSNLRQQITDYYAESNRKFAAAYLNDQQSALFLD